MKKWTIGKPDPKAVELLIKQGSLSQICASVLAARNINTIEKAAEFFNQHSDDEILTDPFLIKDMREAADALLDAVDEGKRICVYGDYDCDGITATAILYSYIECIGGNVEYYINQRSEGYGLCADAVKRLSESGVELIVTVDNGISAINEAKLINEFGMKLIITDHHQPSDKLPEAIAVVDPHRHDDLSPFKDLCGCGVALKLIAAMDGGDYSSALEQFSDLTAIATIADIVPLKGENREIVRQGLHYLENTENIGLQALISVSGIKFPVSSTAAAFSLAPRINASGRFGSASEAVDLLLCEDRDEADVMANRLNALNVERKKIEAEIMDQIHKSILENPSVLYKRVLFLYGEGWHHGVLGIVAAKLVEQFGKPVFILSDDGCFARGSARSVDGFSIYKALTACADVLDKFGGHSGAGGFSLDKGNIEMFNNALQKYAESEFPVMPALTLHADKLILPEELSAQSISTLSLLQPCGEGNPQPLFAMLSVRLLDVLPLSGGTHTKLKLTYGNMGVYGLMFGAKTAEFPYKAGTMLDILAYPEINTYGGQTSVNIRIADLRKSGISQQKYFAAKNAYERYKRGEGVERALITRIVPERNELAVIYKALSPNSISFDSLYFSICSNDINYCKFRLAIDIFEELGLIQTDRYNETLCRLPVEKKVNLDDSQLLAGLKQLRAESI